MYWITGVLSVALFFAPFIFGYTENSTAAWTSYIIGAVTAFVSLIEAYAHDKNNWEYWVAGLLGVAAIAAPFLLGFNTHTTAMWTSIIIGALLAIMAGSRLYLGKR